MRRSRHVCVFPNVRSARRLVVTGEEAGVDFITWYASLTAAPIDPAPPTVFAPPPIVDDVEVLSDATVASFSVATANGADLLVDEVDVPSLLSTVDVDARSNPQPAASSPDASPSSSALASKVDSFGDAALKALDLTFFVAEKVVEEAPRVKEEVRSCVACVS